MPMLAPEEEYRAFDGICLTDTFQLGEKDSDENLYSEQFPTNSKRVMAQKKCPITVIVGNPPYSIGQKSANDNAQNQSYPRLEKHIETTYVAQSEANLNKSAYDSYVKAFRWASDRLNEKGGGVIGFVTNGAWLDANGLDGMRKCFEQEFSSIYVFNLRGNQRTSGELSRKEGGKIFGSGSRTPIAITILVKKHKANNLEKAQIFYHDIGDYLSREDKLKIIRQMGDISNPAMMWESVEPNEHGDWINHRNEMFKLFIPIEPEKKFAKGQKSFFEMYAIGVATNRDAWVYNASQRTLENNMRSMIDFYNRQREAYNDAVKVDKNLSVESFINTDDTKISWTVNLKKDIERNIEHKYVSDIRDSTYRPFFKQRLYFDKPFIERIGLSPKLFPTPNHKNLVICVSGIGASKDFSAIITDCIPDLQLQFNGQCFPLYWYDSSDADVVDLFNQGAEKPMDRYVRKDGVTDWILSTAHKQYGYKVTKEDIFYYVYGLLHSPDYRTAFATDLKKSLPRLPLVEKADDFWTFSKAGRELVDLHLNYETIEPYRKCIVSFAPLTNKGYKINYHVEKMRFGKIDSKTSDKSVIHYNHSITITGIPTEAYEYVVNGKSAIEWIMERYAITTDKKSGITNDPNDWAREHNDEKYIFNLLLRVINVSVQTVEIVRRLPKLKFEE